MGRRLQSAEFQIFGAFCICCGSVSFSVGALYHCTDVHPASEKIFTLQMLQMDNKNEPNI